MSRLSAIRRWLRHQLQWFAEETIALSQELDGRRRRVPKQTRTATEADPHEGDMR